jgi:hypothetical protein
MSIFLRKYLPCGYISGKLLWFRLWATRYGVCVKRTPMLFSERSGLRKTYRLGFGWRLILLKRDR